MKAINNPKRKISVVISIGLMKYRSFARGMAKSLWRKENLQGSSA